MVRKAKQDVTDEKRRRTLDNFFIREYNENWDKMFDVKLKRLRAISDDEWDKAKSEIG